MMPIELLVAAHSENPGLAFASISGLRFRASFSGGGYRLWKRENRSV